ncbi:MAG: hypothetical protein ACYSSL_03740 [Planctomycetota bacterium]
MVGEVFYEWAMLKVSHAQEDKEAALKKADEIVNKYHLSIDCYW